MRGLSKWMIAAVAVTLALTQVPAATAQIVWDNPGVGDWFEPSNWNPASVPGSVDTAVVGNGGEAQAALPAPSDLEVARLEIGSDGGTGILRVTGVPVFVNGRIRVGESDGGTGSSNGTLLITGADLIGNDTSSIDLGEADTPQDATGRIEVDGSLKGFNSLNARCEGQATCRSTLIVGGSLAMNANANLARGQSEPGDTIDQQATVEVTGGSASWGENINVADLFAMDGSTNIGVATLTVSNGGLIAGNNLNIGEGFPTLGARVDTTATVVVEGGPSAIGNALDIGLLSGGGTNPANSAFGSLRLTESDTTASTLRVGLKLDGTVGSALGHLTLDASKLTIAEASEFGVGSTFTTVVRGAGPGQFGALMTTTADLAGDLVIDVRSLPPGESLIDVIVSDSANGISGDFQSVTGVGLPVDIAPRIVVDAGVERYRLTITYQPVAEAPAASTLALLVAAVSLGGIAFLRLRSPRDKRKA